jgi:hypothetical protein
LNQPVLGPQSVGSNDLSHKLEHFWLCGRCAATMTLELQHEQDVVVVSRRDHEFHRATAS